MSRVLAEQLNQSCHCVSVDRAALSGSLNQSAGDPDFTATVIDARPHLFAGTPVFLARSDVAAMMEVMQAAEAAARNAYFRRAVLANASALAQIDHGPRGAFMGYDFHLTDDGPKLIEINTNAGGAFLNAFLYRAQRACCSAAESGEAPAGFDAAVAAMFEAEWRLQRGDRPLRRIAIVDDAPEGQYLYPEFILAQRVLANAGYDVDVTDAQSLRYQDGVLADESGAIDLVYNRLVDFAFEAPEHGALRAAYGDGAVVVTPNPHNHAIHADKRNLTLLSKGDQLKRWGLAAQHVEALSRQPKAMRVSSENVERLWAERDRYFFKPASGYGGKAVYRGDKITKGAWAQVCAGEYIAQERVQPSARIVRIGDRAEAHKMDARLYTYDGRLLLVAARLYQGQTTNFRTPGGGFAPVLLV